MSEELVSQLTEIEGRDFDMRSLLRRNAPDHAHFRPREGFDPREQFNRWLISKGRPPLSEPDPVVQPLTARMQETGYLNEYFNEFGIEVDINERFSGGETYCRNNAFNDLVLYRNEKSWDHEGIISELMEVDFGLKIYSAESNFSGMLGVANCTRRVGSIYQVEAFLFKFPPRTFTRAIKPDLKDLTRYVRDMGFRAASLEQFPDNVINGLRASLV